MFSSMSDSLDPEPVPQVLTEAQRRSLLRRCLASALRAGGYGDVAAAEVNTTQRSSNWLLSAFVLMLVWGLSAGVLDVLDGSAWTWPVAIVGVVVAIAFVAHHASGGSAATLLLIGWLATGWLQITGDGHWIVTHAGPAGCLLVVALLTRQIDVRSVRDVAVAVAAIPRAAPLIAPLVLVVLLLPSLSEDVWKVADVLSMSRLLTLSVLTVGLLFVLVVRQLRAELPQVLVSRATALAAQPGRVELTRLMLRARLRDDSFELVHAEAGTFVVDAWPVDGAQYTPLLAATAGPRLTRPLLGRLAVCVGFIAVAVTLYLYALVSTIVRPDVVAGWTGDTVPVYELDLLGIAMSLPTGPYLAITSLLACLAVATFLAFTLIEERFSIALGDALLRLPADRLLALALPYLHLQEERVVDGDPLPEDFDIGAWPSGDS